MAAPTKFAGEPRPRIPLRSITITTAEQEALVCRVFASWSAADAAIHAALPADCFFCKVWFTVAWVDGESYQGRHDVMPRDRFARSILPAHVREYIRNVTGAQRELALELGHTPEGLRELAELLDTHEVDDGPMTCQGPATLLPVGALPPVDPAPSCAPEEWSPTWCTTEIALALDARGGSASMNQPERDALVKHLRGLVDAYYARTLLFPDPTEGQRCG